MFKHPICLNFPPFSGFRKAFFTVMAVTGDSSGPISPVYSFIWRKNKINTFLSLLACDNGCLPGYSAWLLCTHRPLPVSPSPPTALQMPFKCPSSALQVRFLFSSDSVLAQSLLSFHSVVGQFLSGFYSLLLRPRSEERANKTKRKNKCLVLLSLPPPPSPGREDIKFMHFKEMRVQ